MTELEEAIVPFPVPRDQIPMGTEFKSTWLTSSVQLLREHGYFERYLANLPTEHHEAILHSIAGVWLPAEVCVAHYRAANELGLTAAEQILMGRRALANMQKTIVSFGFRVAREAGVTPLSTLKSLSSAWEREWRGGAIGVWKIGPKDARVEMVGFGGCAFPYCRNGMRGITMGLCELVCTKAYAQEIGWLCTPTTMGLRVSWA